eukprot:727518-Lingulodinium_polyedra.AAC.1
MARATSAQTSRQWAGGGGSRFRRACSGVVRRRALPPPQQSAPPAKSPRLATSLVARRSADHLLRS